MKEEKYHTFSLSFNYTDGLNSGFCNCYAFRKVKKITSKDINECKSEMGIGISSSVMLACSYLGYMTKSEALGE